MNSLQRRVLPFTSVSFEVENGDQKPFKFSGKITINFNVLSDAQQKTGHNFLEGGLGWVDNPAQIKALFWASLIPFQKEFDSAEGLEAVGEYMTLENRLPIVEALLKSFSSFIKKDRREEFDKASEAVIAFLKTGQAPEQEPPAPAPLASDVSTGSSSGASVVTTSDSATTISVA